MITIKDVAKEAGVGVTTVSRVINKNGYASKEIVERIEKAIAKLGYYPNQIARNFKMQRSNLIALLIPTINHPFFAKLAYYLEKFYSEIDSRLLIVNTQGCKEKELKMLDMLKTNHVDGIIFVTQHSFDEIDNTKPLVSIDSHLTDETPYVTSENERGTEIAINYLLERGCKRIGAICGISIVKSEVEKRGETYRQIMKKHNLPILISESNFDHGDEQKVVESFLSANPTIDGLFLGSDLLAVHAFNHLKSVGKRIPEDVQIIGFDGILREWNNMPAITTIQQDIKAMAYAAANILKARIDGKPFPRIEMIPVILIPGETTQQ